MSGSSSPPSIGPVRTFGRYTLVRKLATGGMAEIWLARQRGLAGFNRFVVIKKILAHLSEQQTFVQMFLDEARTSAQLNHPNIVQIFDLGREDDAYYIAMEYIAGENLAALAWRAARKEGVPLAFTTRVVGDACGALHYAHFMRGPDGTSLDIVHRDVSPQNVLVSFDGQVKVVDFGIAKAATKNEQTKTGTLKGKFSYMSPEQCTGSPIDHRSDIFALGILLYELSTGKRLFKHESELMILEMITKRSIVRPREIAPSIPQDLEEIIMRALQKSPERRYATAAEMQADLAQLEQADSAAMGALVRDLFDDRRREIQQVLEVASREDFELAYGGSSAQRRRTVFGASPSVIVQGVPTGAHPHTSPTRGINEPTAGTGATAPERARPSVSVAYTDVETRGGAKPSRAAVPIIAIGAALFVIGAGGAVIASRFLSNDEPTPAPVVEAQPNVPVGAGEVTLETSPPGAVISLDGAPLLDAGGAPSVTPAVLGPLDFGRVYRVRMVLDGYEAHELPFQMTPDAAGSVIDIALNPEEGHLEFAVVGDGGPQTRIFVDGTPVGWGPRLSHEVESGRPVRVSGTREGYTCTANPSTLTVPPGRTQSVSVTCRPRRAPAKKPAQGAGAKRATASAARAPDSTGCVPDDKLRGWITIDTRPHSEIFWRGRRLGETPVYKAAVPSGCLLLEARSPLGKKTIKVEIEPNKITVFQTKL